MSDAYVSALEPFIRPLKTITYVILDTNSGLHSVYLVDILLFYFTLCYSMLLYLLCIIYVLSIYVILMYLPIHLKFPNLWESRLNRVENLCQNIYHPCREVSSVVIRCTAKEKKREERNKEDNNDLANTVIKT